MNYLEHHGIKGMKWGVRRYQNEDGLLTRLGRYRYKKAADAAQRDADDLRKHGYNEEADAVQKVADKNRKKSKEYNGLTDKQKKYLKTGVKVTAVALIAAGTAYTAKKLNTKITSSMIENCKSLGKKYCNLAIKNDVPSIKDGFSDYTSYLNKTKKYLEKANKFNALANNPKSFTVKDKIDYARKVGLNNILR